MADLKSVLIGATSGMIATLCCTLPLAAVAFGIGSISTALTVPQYKLYFLAFSLLFLGSALGIYLKRNPSCCTVQNRGKFVAAALAAYVVVYFLMLYAIAPVIASYVYR